MERQTEIVLRSRGDSDSPEAKLFYDPPADPDEETAEIPEVPDFPEEMKAETAPTVLLERVTAENAEPTEKTPDLLVIPGRDYIVAYEGRFIGHYRANTKVSTRKALCMVARRLEGAMGPLFDIERLDLFKPVPLKVSQRPSGQEVNEGGFFWFAPPAEF